MSALHLIHHQIARTLVSPAVDPLARIAPGVDVPADVTVQSGAYIPAGVVIESGCFIGANVAFVDPVPDGSGASAAVMRKGAWIGANATIYPGVTIGAKAVVRPGSVVTRSVPPAAIVEGSPATIVGYVGAVASAPQAPHLPPGTLGAAVESTPVAGVTVRRLPLVRDLRGDLTVGEFGQHVPFEAKRYFMVFGVPNREVRGEHAHRTCHQFLVCARGDCAVIADDGVNKVEVALDAPNKGLHLPPRTWGIQYKHSPDAVLLVFTSHHYDPADYIRDYETFLGEVGA